MEDTNMIENTICIGGWFCNGKGPCIVDSSITRMVWHDYYKSSYHSSDWWSTYNFEGTRQCIDVINQREDIFQCERCGHYFEDYILHTITDDEGYKWNFCPDCYERLTAINDSKDI
jgi:hypothetical protein